MKKLTAVAMILRCYIDIIDTTFKRSIHRLHRLCSRLAKSYSRIVVQSYSRLVATAVLALSLAVPVWSQAGKGAIKPVNFAEVRFDDAFWKPRMDKVAAVTVPVCITYTEEKTGRIRNFDRAAGKLEGPHEGIFYDDSDVFKALEAMAYTLKIQPNAAIEKKPTNGLIKSPPPSRPTAISIRTIP